MRSELLQKQIYSEMGVYNTSIDLTTVNNREDFKSSSPLKPQAVTGGTPLAAGSKVARRQWDEENAPPPPSSQAKPASASTSSNPRSDSKSLAEPRGNLSDAKRRLFEEDPSPRNSTPQPFDSNQLPLPNPEFFNAASATAVGSATVANRHTKSAVTDTPFAATATDAGDIGLNHLGHGRNTGIPPSSAESGRAVVSARGPDTSSSDFLWDLSPESILSHSSDSQVKPIVGNRAIEDADDPEFSDKNVSFTTFKLDRLTQMSQDELEAHLTQLYKLLYKSATAAQATVANATVVGALTERVTILTYLSSIVACAEVCILFSELLILLLMPSHFVFAFK